MATANLFGEDHDPTPKSAAGPKSDPPRNGQPRLILADRHQLIFAPVSLNSLIPEDHRARMFWLASERLDLQPFRDAIRSRLSGPGRAAVDPRVLLVLWLYATSEGVGSARQLARLCKAHDAYRWIAGGLEVCHRVLSDFRVQHGDKLDRLLTEMLAALTKAKVITLKYVAQDGTKVRASAGAASFRSKKSLDECLEEAQEQVDRLKTQLDNEDESTDGRKRAAKERAAKQRQESVAAAMEALAEIKESRRKNGKKSKPRASTTDPDARVMKMPDGGFRPAYNCQIATDVDSRLIIAARVSNSGGDMGQVEPTLDEIIQRCGETPKNYLVDGGYAKRETVDDLTDREIPIYAPEMKSSKPRTPGKRQRKDSPQVSQWRARMGTDEAKEIYKQRAASIETINGDLKEHRGMRAMSVRGLARAQAVLLWSTLTYNLMRAIKIAPEEVLPSTA